MTNTLCAEGAWCVRFPRPERTKLIAVARGACWFRVEGKEAVRLEEGDVVLLTIALPFVLASDLSAIPREATDMFPAVGSVTARIGVNDDCIVMGGYIRLDEDAGELLVMGLPDWIHVRASSPEASELRWLLERLACERRNDFLGRDLTSSMLAQLILIHILRVYATGQEYCPAGWLGALRDKQISRALKAMHADPGHPWKLEELADLAAMSRTAFATRFQSLLGTPPLTYLLQWRMRLAARSLGQGSDSLSEISRRLGYSSVSAFSHAFKRVTGRSPLSYREDQAAAFRVSA